MQTNIRGITLIWALGVTAALLGVYKYEFTPGDKKESPRVWPSESTIPNVSDRFHLIMFVHPHCPCTRASLRELEKIITRLHEKLMISLVFYFPPGFSEEWVNSYNWKKAASLPHVSTFTDPSGIEATRFGVATSGHVLLYDASGNLLFSGGITQSRGHEGDNRGRDAIVAIATSKCEQRKNPCTLTSVFGCPLLGEFEEFKNLKENP